MKNKLFHILLCLLLLLSLVPSAMAATLDTTDLSISGNTVVIGSGNNATLAELDRQGKTAKIAVPYAQADVYVLKDNSTIVPHNWDKEGYIQFAVPGSGTYVITEGTPGTLEEQLSDGEDNIVLVSAENTLTGDHSVEDGTVIHANGNGIQGTGAGATLTAEGSLQIRDINGVGEIRLGEGDSVSFDAEKNAIVSPSLDKRVGYGSVKVTQPINGQMVTKTYFLVEGEQLVISKDGKISGNKVFAPGSGDASLPLYQITYDAHDNSHTYGDSESVTARCNGLYEYYTLVTITPPGSTTAQKLAEKVDGKDVTVNGVTISKGSTVLTMSNTYLNYLDAGTYTLTFHYADEGAATAYLQVTQQSSEADTSNPKTGDPFVPVFWSMILSAMLLTGVWMHKQKNIF